jgi:hypothetical protein
MHVAFQVLTVFLVASAMGLALAHALELPGKMRLSREQYLAVQPIYYPGFTIGGGIAEAGGIVATLGLLLASPPATLRFWLIGGALATLLIMHLVFWVMTQPANRLWLQETALAAPAKRFFATEGAGGSNPAPTPGWQSLRDRWELSHVLRAIAAMAGLILLSTAIAL